MAAELGIIIENAGGSADFQYFALKTEDIAIQIARTPLQIPVPQGSPFIFDIGSYRPSITISGVVDDIDTADSITFNGSGTELTYYVPTMYQLQVLSTDWVHRQSTQFVYILHSNYDGSNASTQYYDKYECAIQQCRMNLQAGTESKWDYTLQFVTNRLIAAVGAKSENKA